MFLDEPLAPPATTADGPATEEEDARALAARLQLPFVYLDGLAIPDDVRAALPLSVLEAAVAVPFRLEGERLHVAVADPLRLDTIEHLRRAATQPLELAVAPRGQVEAQLARWTSAGLWGSASPGAGADLFTVEQPAEKVDPLQALSLAEGGPLPSGGQEDAPLVRLVNSVILQAADDGASDVHFVQQEDALVVRFRIDGVLHEIQRIPKRLANGVVTRMKVLAELDIAERRRPQDGRLTLRLEPADRILDVRVATLPTVEGETIVMRLLDQSNEPPTLVDLGFADEMRAQLLEIVAKPSGALLVTGPSGAGKSTTLYAALNHINRPEINIITIEDPVEYRLAGVNHIQVNARAGLTFATALRAILRADPDVVMVGEIRDVETAKISIEAAMTGHFVLSTLHTNDAPSALTRLEEMGVEPFLVGSAISAVLAQRLARRLCVHCRQPHEPGAEDLGRLAGVAGGEALLAGGTVFRKRGCPKCGQTGYRGRIGVYQLLRMSEPLQHLAARHATREELEREAMREGMRPMWDDGLGKVAAGLTSLDELARILS
jgi:type IV pilus assembly protein PilB